MTRWKFARLLVVIGAFLLSVDFARPAAADPPGSCDCTGVITTTRIPLANPTCGTHPFYWSQPEYGPGACVYWCEGSIQNIAAQNACDLDAGACTDGGDPFSVGWQATATYQDDWSWSQTNINGYTSCN
jgi:hypothetical protein